MKELIKITQQPNSTIPTVNARDLWEFLGSKRQFANWITERINKYEFVEGVDFTKFNNFVKSKSKPMIEYHISLNMAKELAMVENNDAGKRIRRHFIDIEKRYQQLAPQDYEQAVRQLLTQIEKNKQLESKIVQDAPKVQFADDIQTSDGSTTVGDFAKVLTKRGHKIGQNQLFKALYKLKILINSRRPYQTAVNKGWIEVNEYAFRTAYGTSKIATQVLITGKGQLAIWKKLKGAATIL